MMLTQTDRNRLSTFPARAAAASDASATLFYILLEIAQNRCDINDAFVENYCYMHELDEPDDDEEFISQHEDEYVAYNLQTLDDALECELGRSHNEDDIRKIKFVEANLDNWNVPMFTYEEFLAA